MTQRSSTWGLTLFSVLIFAFAAWPLAQGGRGQATADDGSQLLMGAIDIHIHTLPDDRPRSIDALEVARLAKSKGMRAIVLKNHYESTAAQAFLVRKEVPGIEVFGGIDLNLTVGGINPAAVEHMTKMTGQWGRFVWMSTFDAENQVKFSKEDRPFVSVSRNGELLPATNEVIGLIAKHGLVLATGHVSAQEGLMLVREGKRQGVQHMVVTHAMGAQISMTVDQMKEAAAQGAFIEFVGGSTAMPDASDRWTRMADAIRKVGPDYCILSTDLGQQGSALPPDGFGTFMAAMRARGITDAELSRMAKQNPASLLGLK